MCLQHIMPESPLSSLIYSPVLCLPSTYNNPPGGKEKMWLAWHAVWLSGLWHFPPGYMPLRPLLFCPVRLIDAGISFCLRVHGMHPEHQVPRSRHSLCGYCRAICTICTVANGYCFPAVPDPVLPIEFISWYAWLENSWIYDLVCLALFLDF